MPVKDISKSVIVLAVIRQGIELKCPDDPDPADGIDQCFLQMRTRIGDRMLPFGALVAEAWGLLSVPDPPPPTCRRWQQLPRSMA